MTLWHHSCLAIAVAVRGGSRVQRLIVYYYTICSNFVLLNCFAVLPFVYLPILSLYLC